MKHRLTGAAVLLAVGVIFIPMLLKGPDDAFGPDDDIPPLPKQQFEDRLAVEAAKAPVVQVPLESLQGTSAQLEAAAAEGVAPPLDEAPPAPSPAPTPETKPEPEPSPTPASAPVVSKPAPTPPAPAAPAGWLVQVGSFSQQANADSLRDQLKAQGYAVRVDAVREGGNTSWRVRVGPEQDRAGAEKLRDKLLKNDKLKGIIQQSP